MPYLVLHGRFDTTSNVSTDGDSTRFEADDSTLFDELPGLVEFKANGQVQLRYEGIDALEKAATLPFSADATKANRVLLGGDAQGQTDLPGCILTKEPDGNGRPVCFAFAGAPAFPNGAWVNLDADGLKQSVNYRLVADGSVYPMFYEELYQELRDVLSGAVAAARVGAKGVHAADRSTSGFVFPQPVNPGPDLRQLPPIFPKLWRRLEKFYNKPANRPKPLSDFLAWLATQSDRCFVLSTGQFVKFSTVIEVLAGNAMRMKHVPENLVFRP